MKILALEFSSPQRSVAVLARTHTSEQLREMLETGSRGSRAVSMIDEVLHAQRVEREEIECIAVGLGPGSYTGIRAAIALAQGWQLARPVKLLGISSVEAIAAQAQADGLTGLIHIVIDAQRNELYWAAYELNETNRREVAP